MDFKQFEYSVLPPFIQSLPSGSQNHQKADNQLKQTQSFGAGPMDLENESENQSFIGARKKDLPEEIVATTAGTSVTSASAPLIMPNDLFLNGMGFPAPQNYMMMPQMVMDPNVLQCTMLPQIAASIIPQRTTPASQTAENSTPAKEIITYKSCVLYPPNINAPPPTIRERPLGCRTVFVGGLPEAITQDIIREVFERCGEITTLRLSKKNFCHIRFDYEASVDSAIYLSGYRIKINNSNEATYNASTEQRHKEQDRFRSVSPPPVVHYSDHEAVLAADLLKSDETFLKGIQIVIAWLERGDCCKKNANNFYSMIQSVNAHGRRLNSERSQQDEELKKIKEQYRKNAEIAGQQFSQIDKVFNAASHKKVWDHFTKAQRKNIDQWKKASLDMRTITLDEDEMEMSDDDRDSSRSSKRSRWDDSLKDENDSLRCQVEAYKHEMNLVKSDIKSDSAVREKQIKVLQETIRNLQTQLIENKSKEKDFNQKITSLEEELKQEKVKQLLLKTKIVEVSQAKAKLADNSGDEKDSKSNEKELPKMDTFEVQVISLVSTFLAIHPFGSEIQQINSYLQNILNQKLSDSELEEILSKYECVFMEVPGNKWILTAFKKCSSNLKTANSTKNKDFFI
uniref:RRM domain-containing protein n=1 Tax=Megaselia scalaris TaxID=36166 RepID=T1GHJ2_MEGSC